MMDRRRTDALLDALGSRCGALPPGDDLVAALSAWAAEIDRTAPASRGAPREARRRRRLRRSVGGGALALAMLTGSSVAAALTGAEIPALTDVGRVVVAWMPGTDQPAVDTDPVTELGAPAQERAQTGRRGGSWQPDDASVPAPGSVADRGDTSSDDPRKPAEARAIATAPGEAPRAVEPDVRPRLAASVDLATAPSFSEPVFSGPSSSEPEGVAGEPRSVEAAPVQTQAAPPERPAHAVDNPGAGRPDTPPGPGATARDEDVVGQEVGTRPPGRETTVPGQGIAPPRLAAVPPAQGPATQGPGATAPGPVPIPPGREGTPPGHGAGPPTEVATTPGRGTVPPSQDTTPPGQEVVPPGQSMTPPGRGTVPPGPGPGTTTPGQETTLPGRGTTPPGPDPTPPGPGTTPPGQGTTPPGPGTTPPGQDTAPAGPGTTPPHEETTVPPRP